MQKIDGLERRASVVLGLSLLGGSFIACGDAGPSAESNVPPTAVSIDEVPECGPEQPDYECLRQLFLPLTDHDWPFDAETVAAAYEPGAFQILPEWKMTALHVLEAMQGTIAGCGLDRYQISEPGGVLELPCGDFLLVGGHEHVSTCEAEGVQQAYCVDEVPFSEAFDIAVVPAPRKSAILPLRDDVRVGEQVFIVGVPSFILALEEASEQEALESQYPLVSTGTVLALDGTGMVISNLAYPGNSGGPVIDREGRVVGVAYSRVDHLRAAGTTVDDSIADHRTVAVRITESIRSRIELEL